MILRFLRSLMRIWRYVTRISHLVDGFSLTRLRLMVLLNPILVVAAWRWTFHTVTEHCGLSKMVFLSAIRMTGRAVQFSSCHPQVKMLLIVISLMCPCMKVGMKMCSFCRITLWDQLHPQQHRSNA